MDKSNKKVKLKDKSLLSYYEFTRTEQRKYPAVTNILKQLTAGRIKS